ncbi:unnamed protein product [Gordionus sp. m RMFG-2023]
MIEHSDPENSVKNIKDTIIQIRTENNDDGYSNNLIIKYPHLEISINNNNNTHISINNFQSHDSTKSFHVSEIICKPQINTSSNLCIKDLSPISNSSKLIQFQESKNLEKPPFDTIKGLDVIHNIVDNYAHFTLHGNESPQITRETLASTSQDVSNVQDDANDKNEIATLSKMLNYNNDMTQWIDSRANIDSSTLTSHLNKREVDIVLTKSIKMKSQLTTSLPLHPQSVARIDSVLNLTTPKIIDRYKNAHSLSNNSAFRDSVTKLNLTDKGSKAWTKDLESCQTQYDLGRLSQSSSEGAAGSSSESVYHDYSSLSSRVSNGSKNRDNIRVNKDEQSSHFWLSQVASKNKSFEDPENVSKFFGRGDFIDLSQNSRLPSNTPRKSDLLQEISLPILNRSRMSNTSDLIRSKLSMKNNSIKYYNSSGVQTTKDVKPGNISGNTKNRVLNTTKSESPIMFDFKANVFNVNSMDQMEDFSNNLVPKDQLYDDNISNIEESSRKSLTYDVSNRSPRTKSRSKNANLGITSSIRSPITYHQISDMKDATTDTFVIPTSPDISYNKNDLIERDENRNSIRPNSIANGNRPDTATSYSLMKDVLTDSNKNLVDLVKDLMKEMLGLKNPIVNNNRSSATGLKGGPLESGSSGKKDLPEKQPKRLVDNQFKNSDNAALQPGVRRTDSNYYASFNDSLSNRSSHSNSELRQLIAEMIKKELKSFDDKKRQNDESSEDRLQLVPRPHTRNRYKASSDSFSSFANLNFETDLKPLTSLIIDRVLKMVEKLIFKKMTSNQIESLSSNPARNKHSTPKKVRSKFKEYQFNDNSSILTLANNQALHTFPYSNASLNKDSFQTLLASNAAKNDSHFNISDITSTDYYVDDTKYIVDSPASTNYLADLSNTFDITKNGTFFGKDTTLKNSNISYVAGDIYKSCDIDRDANQIDATIADPLKNNISDSFNVKDASLNVHPCAFTSNEPSKPLQNIDTNTNVPITTGIFKTANGKLSTISPFPTVPDLKQNLDLTNNDQSNIVDETLNDKLEFDDSSIAKFTSQFEGLSLKQALKTFRPDFIINSWCRQQHVSFLSEKRKQRSRSRSESLNGSNTSLDIPKVRRALQLSLRRRARKLKKNLDSHKDATVPVTVPKSNICNTTEKLAKDQKVEGKRSLKSENPTLLRHTKISSEINSPGSGKRLINYKISKTRTTLNQSLTTPTKRELNENGKNCGKDYRILNVSKFTLPVVSNSISFSQGYISDDQHFPM